MISEKESESQRKYYQKTRPIRLQYKKLHYQKNRERFLEQRKIYRQKNREKINEQQRENRPWCKEHMKRYQEKYRYQNKEKIIEQKRKYRQQNKEKIRDQGIKSFKKLNTKPAKTLAGWAWHLYRWSLTIRKQFNDKCFCGNTAIHSHHILHKAKYPELSLNINNGIALCQIHHDEVHGKSLTKQL